MKVNKEKVESVVKKAVVLIAASLATISLFACGGKVETKMEYPSISIDQDANLSNGNNINTKEEMVGGNIVSETNKPLRTFEEAIGNLQIIEKKEIEIPEGIGARIKVLDEDGREWLVSVAYDRQVSRLVDDRGRETLIGSTTETAEQLIKQAKMMDNVSRSMGQID